LGVSRTATMRPSVSIRQGRSEPLIYDVSGESLPRM
jgi:hypothetical protein